MTLSNRIAVIGAGPSGLASAISAISLGFEVELIDPWNDYALPADHEASTAGLGQSLIAKKNFRGSYEMYQYPLEYIFTEKKHSFPISLTRGGLSSVWGANSISWEQASKFLGIDPLHSPVINSLKDYVSIEPSTGRDDSFTSSFLDGVINRTQPSRVKILPSRIAYFEDKCIRCGECLLGCKYDAIFNASIAWETLIRTGKVKLIPGFVNRVSEKGEGVLVHYSHELLSYTREYSKIFIGCGAIASASLLMRSDLLSEQALLSDTQVFYTGFLKKQFKAHVESNFTLAHAYASIKHKDQDVHISIYEASKEAISRAATEIKLVPKALSRILLRWIAPGIGFIPQSESAKIFIERKRSGQLGPVEVTFSDNSFAKHYVKLLLIRNFFQFAKLGLIPLPFVIKTPNPGASYHVGVLEDAKGPIGDKGSIANLKNIFLVDSSALSSLPSGPITIPTMLNAGTITMKALLEVKNDRNN